jgi:hypothetical protein
MFLICKVLVYLSDSQSNLSITPPPMSPGSCYTRSPSGSSSGATHRSFSQSSRTETPSNTSSVHYYTPMPSPFAVPAAFLYHQQSQTFAQNSTSNKRASKKTTDTLKSARREQMLREKTKEEREKRQDARYQQGLNAQRVAIRENHQFNDHLQSGKN